MGLVLDNLSSYSLSDAEASLPLAAHSAEREFYFPGFLTSTRLISLELQARLPPPGLEMEGAATQRARGARGWASLWDS
jgi:hypothetical protein